VVGGGHGLNNGGLERGGAAVHPQIKKTGLSVMILLDYEKNYIIGLEVQ
jgi:hypothetical protein